MRKRGRDSEPTQRLSAAAGDPWLALAAGIMLQAAKDAQSGDLGAAQWLAGPDGELYAHALGFDRRPVLQKAAAWRAAPAGKIVIRLCFSGGA